MSECVEKTYEEALQLAKDALAAAEKINEALYYFSDEDCWVELWADDIRERYLALWLDSELAADVGEQVIELQSENHFLSIMARPQCAELGAVGYSIPRKFI